MPLLIFQSNSPFLAPWMGESQEGHAASGFVGAYVW